MPGYCYKLLNGNGKFEGPQQYGLDAVYSVDPGVDESDMSFILHFADGTRRDGVGDLLNVEGIDTSRHRANPISLFDHGKTVALPIGYTETRDTREYTVFIDPVARSAKAKVFVYDGRKGIDGAERNLVYDHAIFCEQIFDMWAKRLIRAGSIGYQVIEAEELPQDWRKGIPKGLLLNKVLMLEASAVVLPANGDTVRKCLSLPKVCGKPLSPYLIKALQPYAQRETKVSVGFADVVQTKAAERWWIVLQNGQYQYGPYSSRAQAQSDLNEYAPAGSSAWERRDRAQYKIVSSPTPPRGYGGSEKLLKTKRHSLQSKSLDRQGGEIPTDPTRAQKVDLITLPEGVEGTNCSNCRWVTQDDNGGHRCTQPMVKMAVTARNCCAMWDAEGVIRSWEQSGVNMHQPEPQEAGNLMPGEKKSLKDLRQRYGAKKKAKSWEGFRSQALSLAQRMGLPQSKLQAALEQFHDGDIRIEELLEQFPALADLARQEGVKSLRRNKSFDEGSFTRRIETLSLQDLERLRSSAISDGSQDGLRKAQLIEELIDERMQGGKSLPKKGKAISVEVTQIQGKWFLINPNSDEQEAGPFPTEEAARAELSKRNWREAKRLKRKAISMGADESLYAAGLEKRPLVELQRLLNEVRDGRQVRLIQAEIEARTSAKALPSRRKDLKDKYKNTISVGDKVRLPSGKTGKVEADLGNGQVRVLFDGNLGMTTEITASKLTITGGKSLPDEDDKALTPDERQRLQEARAVLSKPASYEAIAGMTREEARKIVSELERKLGTGSMFAYRQGRKAAQGNGAFGKEGRIKGRKKEISPLIETDVPNAKWKPGKGAVKDIRAKNAVKAIKDCDMQPGDDVEEMLNHGYRVCEACRSFGGYSHGKSMTQVGKAMSASVESAGGALRGPTKTKKITKNAAWQEGFDAKKYEDASRKDNPYPAGSDDYKNWDAGWDTAWQGNWDVRTQTSNASKYGGKALPAYTKSSKMEDFMAGRDAFIAGTPMSSNPYPRNSPEWRNWAEGWASAKTDPEGASNQMLRRQGSKSLKDLRSKYKARTAKGLRRRLRKSVPGVTVMDVDEKDMSAAREACEAKGIKFHRLGDTRVKLVGQDEAIDEVAKSFATRVKHLPQAGQKADPRNRTITWNGERVHLHDQDGTMSVTVAPERLDDLLADARELEVDVVKVDDRYVYEGDGKYRGGKTPSVKGSRVIVTLRGSLSPIEAISRKYRR